MFGLLGMANCGKVERWGSLWKISVSEVFTQTQVGVIPVIRKESSALPGTGEGKGNIFTKGNLCLAFEQKVEVQRVLSAFAVSQYLLAQNNLYAKVA